MKRNLFTLVCFAVILFLLGTLAFFQFKQTKKIVYVETGKLMAGYQAMIDAKQEFDLQTREWQSNIDTLRTEVELEIKTYQQDAPSMSAPARAEAEKKLQTRQQQFLNYRKAIEEKAANEEARLGEQIIQRMNTFMRNYGREHGYDLILGTNEASTILHADERLDVTQDVLDALNEQYSQRKIK